MIQRVDADRVEHRQTDDARQRNVRPAAGGLERRRRTVPRIGARPSVLTARRVRLAAKRIASAAGTNDRRRQIVPAARYRDVLDEVGNVGLKLANVVDIATRGSGRFVATNIEDVDICRAALRNVSGQRREIRAVVAGSMQQDEFYRIVRRIMRV